jgi:hypothetical protein
MHDLDNAGGGTMHGISLKGTCVSCTVRGNTFNNIGDGAIAAWFNGYSGYGELETNVEVLFNKILTTTGQALSVNQANDSAGIYHIYRNTFYGTTILNSIDSNNGPYYMNNNVIVNTNNPQISCDGTACGSQVVEGSAPNTNLKGAPSDGIVYLDGTLQPAYQQYVGVKGFQINNQVPQTPTGLIVR